MIRRLIVLLGVAYILAGIGIGYVVYMLDSQNWSWKQCAITVEVEDGLSPEKIKIEYQPEGGYNRVVFENGHMIPFETEYGKNRFTITYDKKYYLAFGQWILNNHRYHTYNLKLSQPGNAIWVDADIEGFHAMQLEEPMEEIAGSN